jgi:ABC-type transport system involved in multi-copper enzyme maturation permease subunit
MLKTIIEKEIRDNILSTKFAVTFGICSLLILLSFYVGAKNHKIAQARYEATKVENLRQLNGLTDWLQVNNFRVFLPPQPLAALVSGISNDIGRNTEVNGRGELKHEDTIFGDDPIYAVFRFLDLEFIFQIVLSLFAILFAYDSINGEKERGTLRLTFAYQVPRDIYISGKLIGAFLSLTVPLLIPILLGGLLMPILGINMNMDEWMRLGLILLTGFLYVAVFLSLSVFISSSTQKTSVSFLTLLVIWVLSVMIVPRLSVAAAGAIVDVPGIDEINSKKAKLTSQLWSEDRNAIGNFKPEKTDDMEKMMQQFNKFMQDRADEREKKLRDLSSRLNEERNNKLDVRNNLGFTLARISPASSYTFASSSLAGTSMQLEDEYKNALNDYQTKYGDFMFEKTGMRTSGFMRFQKIEDGAEMPESINANEIPQFEYKSAALSSILPAVVLDAGLLVLFNIIFFAGAFISFRKYDVR